jgi:urocanate hydratase
MRQESILLSLEDGIPEDLPAHPGLDGAVDHAPPQKLNLTNQEQEMAVRNALRYLPEHQHAKMAPELAEELLRDGRIRMLRLRPTEYEMKAHPIEKYPAKIKSAAAIMLMIQNNLDPDVAQFPNELITYGGNGAVFQNWAQYRLTMSYLSRMTESQTLVMYSGHPLGLFPSSPDAPRLVITNGMVIPNHSKFSDYERMNALGVTQYGQMTAGSYMYIGPQGIVHGTMITILNAARKYLGRDSKEGLEGLRYVSSGLGGMSGAQAKAAVISGVTTIIAEVNRKAAVKRHEQKWVDILTDRVDDAIDLLVHHSDSLEAVSIGYIGNIVDLWERLAERDIRIDMGSDQTSLHNPLNGGYIPVGMSLAEANITITDNNKLFEDKVRSSLRRQIIAIDKLTEKGMRFWDYGNAFLLEANRSGCDLKSHNGGFRYPSYVEDIMGPMCFDYGFGPFRWVCCSADPEDLSKTDIIAKSVLSKLLESAPKNIQLQIEDNLKWITGADEYKLVVGSQARILYADEQGRRKIASALNSAIKSGEISAPIIIGRDHHDVSGTDSPYRETANIRDGSMFTADMSVQNFVGDSFRGATWVSLHNGGGVGWGEVSNGGFGLLLDGSARSEKNLQSMIDWDVNNGIARRAWARNQGALEAISFAMQRDSNLQVTIPFLADDELITKALNKVSKTT